MTGRVEDLGGVRVLVLSEEGPELASERHATDIIGDALGHEAVWVAAPLSRLPDAFFRLASGLAGAVLQKFVNYGVRIAFIGDISERTAISKPLHDFVFESNRGRHVWFVDDLKAFEAKLSVCSEDH